MRTFRRFVLAPVVLAGAIVALGTSPAAAASPPPNPEINVFEIEAHTLYCQSGGAGCVQRGGDISALRFADATVWRFSPLPGGTIHGDTAFGKPELVHAVCATHYRDSLGHIHARAIDFTGTSLSVPGVPSARIDGSALVAAGAETSQRAIGAMQVTATAAGGDKAQIVGAQIANNTNDSRVAGGFHITVNGTVVDTDFQTGQSTPLGAGQMRCSTDVSPVTAPFPGPAPNTFSSEVNDNGDPS